MDQEFNQILNPVGLCRHEWLISVGSVRDIFTGGLQAQRLLFLVKSEAKESKSVFVPFDLINPNNPSMVNSVWETFLDMDKELQVILTRKTQVTKKVITKLFCPIIVS